MSHIKLFGGGTFDWTHAGHLIFVVASRLASIDYLTEKLGYTFENDQIDLTMFFSANQLGDYDNKKIKYSQQKRRIRFLEYPFMTRFVDDILFLSGDYDADMKLRLKYCDNADHVIYLFGPDQTKKPWAQKLRTDLSSKLGSDNISFLWIKEPVLNLNGLEKYSSSSIIKDPWIGKYHWEDDLFGLRLAKDLIEGHQNLLKVKYEIMYADS